MTIVSAPSPLSQNQQQLLDRSLTALFEGIAPQALDQLKAQLSWVDVPGGQTLMSQGDAGDAMYLVISGRLRAVQAGADGTSRLLREMSRGQVIGELSLITGELRSATVAAVRDSVLVRLSKQAFDRLLAGSGELSLAMTRQIVRRLQHPLPQPALAVPVTMAVVPASDGVDAAAFAHALAAALAALPRGGRATRVRVLDAEAAQALVGDADSDPDSGGDADTSRRLSLALDALEAEVDHVLLVADATPSAWTQRCARQADELLLLVDATRPPTLHVNETGCLMQRPDGSGGLEVLVLLHPDVRAQPHGTAAWLRRRPVADHVHLRRGDAAGMARLARLQARQATGLVFAGGGAKGLAHLGVWRALRERGVEIDVVGGTSIGGVMAALVALDRPFDEVVGIARHAFLQKPTSDFNLLPLVSLIRGRRLRQAIDGSLKQLCGGTVPDIEDLWKGFFCIATNYTKARPEVLRRGPLGKLVRAGLSIPGALPPVVHDGDLLCDGGTFDNFPVGVMRSLRGVGYVIGVDLHASKSRRLTFDEVPGPWTLLLDRLRPRARRRYRLPSLSSFLLNATILYSLSRQGELEKLADLTIRPPLERIGMLQWGRFDEIVRQGHEHAQAALAGAALPAAAGTG